MGCRVARSSASNNSFLGPPRDEISVRALRYRSGDLLSRMASNGVVGEGERRGECIFEAIGRENDV